MDAVGAVACECETCLELDRRLLAARTPLTPAGRCICPVCCKLRRGDLDPMSPRDLHALRRAFVAGFVGGVLACGLLGALTLVV